MTSITHSSEGDPGSEQTTSTKGSYFSLTNSGRIASLEQVLISERCGIII